MSSYLFTKNQRSGLLQGGQAQFSAEIEYLKTNIFSAEK